MPPCFISLRFTHNIDEIKIFIIIILYEFIAADWRIHVSAI